MASPKTRQRKAAKGLLADYSKQKKPLGG